MSKDIQLKKYNKKMEHSYTLGAFPTIELLLCRPKDVIKVLIHSQLYRDKQFEKIVDLCEKNNIKLEEANKVIERIRDKENCLVIGVFQKYTNILNKEKDHVVLVNPSDMGNIGTIIRTCVGFGIKDLAIISPGVDIYNPKVVRASMGSLFHLYFIYFNSFEEYKNNAGERHMYPFMLEGATELTKLSREKTANYSLVFGNEASGLDAAYQREGTSVFIPHSSEIDSLNLSMAVGIGLFEFTRKEI
jgi:rRNA methylases